MPAHVVNQVQFAANSQKKAFVAPTPEPATEVLVNGGGLYGDTKWTPPKRALES
jgi:hypothetical protein